MASLDSFADSAPQSLGEPLQFRLPSTSDAVQNGGRRETVFFPQGGNQVSSTGVRECSFRIGADAATMLDPSQGLFLKFKVTDTSGSANTMNLPAWGVWSKIVIRCAGVEVESIDNYNRLQSMLLALSDPMVKNNMDTSAGEIGEQLAGNASAVFGHRLVTGITECGKLIPLKYCPLEITLTCDPDLVGEAFSGAVTISDLQLHVTQLDVTSDVAETLFSHLSSGKGLPLHYQTWYCTQQACTTHQTIHVSAAKSRLDKIFVSFSKNASLDARDFVNPGATLELGATLGSKRIPERDLKDLASFWDMLSRCVGRKAIMDITRNEFGAQATINSIVAEKKFIVGLPIERMPDQAYTGYDMKSGQALSLTWKNAGNSVTKAWVCLYHSCVLEIKDSEITRYD